MENKELMRIFAAYMPCEMQYHRSGHNNSDYKVPIYAKSIEFEDGTVWGSNPQNDLNGYPAISCKLKLKPLSKIADEDAAQVARIYKAIPTPFGIITEHSPISKIKQMVQANERHYYAVVDYLRSAGYDCGYGQISSLIDAGIAVEQ